MKYLLEVAAGSQPQVSVLSDEDQIFPRAVQEMRCRVTHHITSSQERRTAPNQLFPLNLADSLVRHGSANSRRETIAWRKRRPASAERLAIFPVWRIYLNGQRAKARGCPTPAPVRAMLDHRVSVAELLARQRRHELKYAV